MSAIQPEGAAVLAADLARLDAGQYQQVAEWMLAHGWTEPLDPTPETAPAHPMACLRMAPDGEMCGQDVHGWFELSYASYLVLPRALMQEMAPAWQHAMVALLERAHEVFPEAPAGYTVYRRDGAGRFTSDPLRNYRYPSARALAAARGEEQP